MAQVIKQQTQVFNKPVGVIRTAGGAEQLGQTISRVAGSLADREYQVAADEAQDVGAKAGMAVASSDVVAIDPTTNLPISHTPPPAFGRIAAESYQDLIDRRFADSLQSEIQTKGAEIAANSRSAAQYKDRMSNYVEAMYNADGSPTAYTRMIAEGGAKYIASTYKSLRAKEVAAHKAAVVKSNRMKSFEQLQKINAGIASGANPEEMFSLIEQERSRNESLFQMSGGITFSQYKSNVEKLNGLASLQSNQELVNLYAGLPDWKRKRLEQAIQNPSLASNLDQVLGEEDGSNAAVLIASARLTDATGSILSGLRAAGEVDDSIDEMDVNGIVGLMSISPDTNYGDITRTVAEYGPNLRESIRVEATRTFLMKKMDASEISASGIDALTIELDSSTPDFSKIAKLIGATSENGIESALQAVSADDLSELATGLKDKRAQLGRLEGEATRQRTSDLDSRILNLNGQSPDKMVESFDAINQTILGMDDANRISLQKRLGESFVTFAINAQKKIDVTHDAYADIQAAVIDGKAYNSPVANNQKVYTLLKKIQEVSRTSAASEMSSRLKVLADGVKESNESAVLNSKVTASKLGKFLNKEDATAVGQSIFGDAPLFIRDLANFPEGVEIFNQGIVLPQVANAMSLALDSNDPNEILTSIQMFEQGVNTSQTLPSGQVIPADSMRNSLSEDDYALYSSVLFASRNYSEDPVAVLAALRSYDGNIDADIKKDFEIAASASVGAILDDTPMSPQYRKEIIQSLRIIKAKTGSVGQENLDRLIKGYTDQATKDKSIVGFSIGDQSVYGRGAYIGVADVIRNEAALVQLMVSDGGFADLLEGGTFADAAIESLGSLSGRRILEESASLVESLTGGMTAQTKAARSRQLERGLPVLQEQLLYKPNLKSFARGMPSWTVGYDDGFGFTPILVNGAEWTLDTEVRESNDKASNRIQSSMQLTFAKRSGAPLADIARAEINYLATLDHMDIDTFTGVISTKGNRLGRALQGEDPIAVFEEARKKHEDLP